MNDKKMISIDQFDAAEQLEVEETLQALTQKYRLKTGKEPDSKKEKELSAQARQVVMTAKLAREKEKAERAAKKPLRKRNPLRWQKVKWVILTGQPQWRAVSGAEIVCFAGAARWAKALRLHRF